MIMLKELGIMLGIIVAIIMIIYFMVQPVSGTMTEQEGVQGNAVQVKTTVEVVE